MLSPREWMSETGRGARAGARVVGVDVAVAGAAVEAVVGADCAVLPADVTAA